MEAIEMIKTRRSVRSFKPNPVDMETLDRVLETATYAPSGKGKQLAQIVCVTDRGATDKLRRMNADVLGIDSDPYYGAPVIVVVLAPKSSATPTEDGSAVLMTMALAVHAEGLAACWINREQQMFDSPEGKALLREWGLSEDLRGVGALAIGYADGSMPEPMKRRDDYIINV